MPPAGKHFLVLAGIGTIPDRPADRVEDDLRVRKHVSEASEFGDPRMVEPGVEREGEAAEHRETLSEALVGHEPGRRAVGWIGYRGPSFYFVFARRGLRCCSPIGERFCRQPRRFRQVRADNSQTSLHYQSVCKKGPTRSRGRASGLRCLLAVSSAVRAGSLWLRRRKRRAIGLAMAGQESPIFLA
jgi:hypothetical protein